MKNDSVNDSFKKAFGNFGKDLMGATRQMQTGDVSHVSGLPVPQGIPCTLAVTDNELAIRAAGQNFRVPMDRIFSAEENTDTETRQHIGSSMGQTLLGGLAFGEVGAVIGAMPKSSHKKAVSKYKLTVGYQSEAGEPKALVFSADGSLKCWVRDINKRKRGVPPAASGGFVTL